MLKIKNGFLAKIGWHYLCQEGRKNAHFRAHYLFWPKNFLGPKQCKPGKTIKIVVSAESAQNQKWHLFLEKGVFFDMGEKVGFTNCVFEKLCFPENTILIVLSAKHSFSKTKLYVEKTENGFLGWIFPCFQGEWPEIFPPKNPPRKPNTKIQWGGVHENFRAWNPPAICCGFLLCASRKPLPDSPPKGTPDPRKFFMFGASFLFKTQETPKHEEFQGGGS